MDTGPGELSVVPVSSLFFFFFSHFPHQGPAGGDLSKPIKRSLPAPLLLPVPTAKRCRRLCYCPLFPSHSSSGSFPSCHRHPLPFSHSPPTPIILILPCSSPFWNFFTCYFVSSQLTTHLVKAVSNLLLSSCCSLSALSPVMLPNSRFPL